MNGRSLLARAGMFALFALFGCASSNPGENQAESQSLVVKAATTVDTMKESGGTKTAALLEKAKGVVIFPDLVKGGAVVGASRGQGVLLAHGPHGWSDPAFYEATSISVGLQLGGEQSSVVMFLMDQPAVDSLLKSSSYSLKASGGLSMADYNTANQQQLAGADIIVWSKSKGAYGGLTVSGSDLSQRFDLNNAFYGRALDAAEITAGAGKNAKANPLRKALAG